MPVVLPEQGRSGTVGEPPINLDWIAKDPDIDLPVYIIVSGPRDGSSHDLRGLHWRLSWQVARDKWRYVHIVEHWRDHQRAPNPRYVYWGALTQSSGHSTSKSTKVLVGVMSLATRKNIEQLRRDFMTLNFSQTAFGLSVSLSAKKLSLKLSILRKKMVKRTERREMSS